MHNIFAMYFMYNFKKKRLTAHKVATRGTAAKKTHWLILIGCIPPVSLSYDLQDSSDWLKIM